MDTIKLNELNTGDILLFDEHPKGCLWKLLDGCIKFCTKSKYSHSALVLKDPEWLGLKGIYVWESTGFTHLKDAVDHVEKFGIQIHDITEYTNLYKGKIKIYVRSGTNKSRKQLTNEKLRELYDSTHNKPYDAMPFDWLEAMVKIGPRRRTDMFWCSAFISYILTKTGIMNKNTDWSMQSPQDLSFKSNSISWEIPYSNDKLLKY